MATSSDHVYVTPVKLIKGFEDMEKWKQSEAYSEYLGFIYAINEAIRGKSNSAGSENASEQVDKIIEILNTLDKWIDETPPIQQPQRFGNQAFKTWYNRLKEESANLLESALPEPMFNAITEIAVYFEEGFGNSTRIDYGTGHELSFVMFLCCLFKIGYFTDKDNAATGCKVFVRYLNLVRKLQLTYRMEPAGSHGVWSLDDYQFVPFIWGSAQLMGHHKLEPAQFVNPEIAIEYANEYMFLSCIKYINEVKTGPFAEHSNQLWSISAVSTWTKVNIGLLKMYKAEVLNKFPLAQHIVFGSLFTLEPSSGAACGNPTKSRCTSTALPNIQKSSTDVLSATNSFNSNNKI